MEDLVVKVLIGLFGVIVGSGLTIPIVIKTQNSKRVMKQRGGKESTMIQAGRDVNGK